MVAVEDVASLCRQMIMLEILMEFPSPIRYSDMSTNALKWN